MLRLVYQTNVFGALNFEYSKPRVRVGSCRDNDLVLLHRSVAPYHCVLLLNQDSLTVLPADAGDAPPADDAIWHGPGEVLTFGEVTLRIERSPNSIAVPQEKREERAPGRTRHGYWQAEYASVPESARWQCIHCDIRLEDVQIHAVGLVGGKKHILCPLCSRELVLLTPVQGERGKLLKVLSTGWKHLRRFLRHE